MIQSPKDGQGRSVPSATFLPFSKASKARPLSYSCQGVVHRMVPAAVSPGCTS